MNTAIPSFQTGHILVIGDVMLDQYWHGTTSRISPEAPVPVVRIKEQESRPGGAGNVALNITALGATATLLAVTGTDTAADEIVQALTQKKVQCDFIRLHDVPTITKLRILSRHQQLIRLDFEEGLAALDTESIYVKMQIHLSQVDVVILSDYGKGTLFEPEKLIQAARHANKPVLVDPKGRDFDKYYGATLMTPNLTEFEAVVGHCSSQEQLVEKGEQLREQLNLEALLITRSEQGMTLLRRGHTALHLPAHAREVYDVTGAGDTVIGVLAASLAAGHDLVNATTLANIAAGLVVAKLGAETVTVTELEHVLNIQHEQGIYDEKNLQTLVQSAQANGETIVMTNGCFDILHAGHIQYLTQARQLGDKLIVAVNDDNSVKRLKGETRPVNQLAHRMAVLNALECVDWVIPFSADTPRELICQLMPDILVKGGDYNVAEIAGSDCILGKGGKVLTLDFVPNCSTTQIIHSLTTDNASND